ncbi:odorant receptor 46a-like [Formica exsecta]|uniref:odorant receptor 46a-like n=1 Tax=Formica exsecta TaxID=72781 RepID=UPI001142EEB7|nr:odorant receptor 46a-like [Formica exsecta]
MDLPKENLTYRAWLPFDYTPPSVFYFVFTHQLIGMMITAAVNVACDSLISGFLQQICCQLEILKYAYTVNRRFVIIIAVQFVVSMLVVCANLYKLASITNLKINGDLITLILYTACMLSQIFIYCWFGNELKLKSLTVVDSIYNMEWQILDNSSQKALLFIMRRSIIPIEFNSVIIITLNLDSFVSLLKTSYSAYNVLKRTS